MERFLPLLFNETSGQRGAGQAPWLFTATWNEPGADAVTNDNFRATSERRPRQTTPAPDGDEPDEGGSMGGLVVCSDSSGPREWIVA